MLWIRLRGCSVSEAIFAAHSFLAIDMTHRSTASAFDEGVHVGVLWAMKKRKTGAGLQDICKKAIKARKMVL